MVDVIRHPIHLLQEFKINTRIILQVSGSYYHTYYTPVDETTTLVYADTQNV